MRFLVILLPQVCEESPVNLITSKSLVFGMIQDVKVFLLLETKPAFKMLIAASAFLPASQPAGFSG